MNIIIYPSHFELMEQLTDEQSGKLIKAIGQYRKGIVPEIDDLLVKGIFISIKRDFDLQAENYVKVCKRNSENGSKGGRPKKPNETQHNPKNPMGLLETQHNPKNLKDKDKDKDKEKDIVVSTGSILENKLRRQENLSEYLDDYFNL
jgi:hypothetical protein